MTPQNDNVWRGLRDDVLDTFDTTIGEWLKTELMLRIGDEVSKAVWVSVGAEVRAEVLQQIEEEVHK